MQLVLAAHEELIASPRWGALAEAGANRQRVLWASISIRDPDLPDTFYVSSLAAPETVNTMPEKTLLAVAQGGRPGPRALDDAGVRPFAARCGALEQAFPFGVVRQLFEPVLMERDIRERALAGAAAAARDVFDIITEPDHQAGARLPDAAVRMARAASVLGDGVGRPAAGRPRGAGGARRRARAGRATAR